MKVICIHGMNQQHYSSQAMTQHWAELIAYGLQKINCSLPKLKLDVAYYADVLVQYHQHNRLHLGDFHFIPPPQDRSAATEHLFTQPSPLRPKPNNISSAYTRQLGESHQNWQQRLINMQYSFKNHIFKDMLGLLDHFPLLLIRLVHDFLMETYLYLSQDNFMQDVHQRILPLFDTTQRHIVIAHSLGSVISYNFLQLHPEFKIEQLITLASPLSFQIVQQHLLQPICRPENLVGDWFNVYSPEDFLTINPLDQAPFKFDRPIINQQILTFNQTPHQLSEYLTHPQVIKYFYQCYTSTI